MLTHCSKNTFFNQYRVSQQVWNTFTKKMYFAPKNCFLSLFCELQIGNGSKKQFALCSNLLSKWNKVALKSHFHFAVHEKRLKKHFFGAKYIFFHKRSSLRSQPFLNEFQTCWNTLYILI